MSMKPSTKKLTLAAAIASALTACGGTGQDGGNSSDSVNEIYTGKAIDGYVARAHVFLDTNNNGTRDAWEPQAFTDNDGYFSSNPETQINYCVDKESDLYRLHCLVSDVAYSNVVIRIKGGYDVSTGEPFLGQMSRRLDNTDTAVDNVLVTPITSLLAEAKTPEAREAMLEALALEQGDVDVDYFKSGDVNQKVLKKALTLHKAVTLLSDRLNDTYDEMGKGFGVSDDASGSVYRALANELVSNVSQDPVLTDQTDYVEGLLKKESFLRQVLAVSEQEVRDIYDQRKIDLPDEAIQPLVTQANAFDTVVDRVKKIPDVTESLLSDESPTDAELTSAVKALETLVIKTINDNRGNDEGVERALDVLQQDGQVRDNLLSALEEPGADLNELADSDFNFSEATDFKQPFVNNAELPPLVNKTITLSDVASKYNFIGSTYQFKDSQIILYIQGEEGADSGKITACVKYINDAKFDANAEQDKRFKLGESNTRGELIVGQWSKLDARQLLIRATYLGSDYQWLIKPKGDDRYQFDFDGDLTIWKADANNESEALTDFNAEDIPADNAACQQKLPLRIDGVEL